MGKLVKIYALKSVATLRIRYSSREIYSNNHKVGSAFFCPYKFLSVLERIDTLRTGESGWLIDSGEWRMEICASSDVILGTEIGAQKNSTYPFSAQLFFLPL